MMGLLERIFEDFPKTSSLRKSILIGDDEQDVV